MRSHPRLSELHSSAPEAFGADDDIDDDNIDDDDVDVAKVSDNVHKAAREEACAAVALECALEPTVLALPVDKHDVAFFELQLGLTLGWVGHHHPVPEGERASRVILNTLCVRASVLA